MAVRVFTEDERRAAVQVWRFHGTSAAATWLGVRPVTVRRWVLDAGFRLRGRGHPSSEETRRAAPRWQCRCAMCAAWRQKERERRAAVSRALSRYGQPPTFEVEQYRGDDWQERSECRGIDPDLFFPTKGESTRPAKAVCAWCPVREACLDYALVNSEKYGIWGGRSERERRRARRVRVGGEAA